MVVVCVFVCDCLFYLVFVLWILTFTFGFGYGFVSLVLLLSLRLMFGWLDLSVCELRFCGVVYLVLDRSLRFVTEFPGSLAFAFWVGVV